MNENEILKYILAIVGFLYVLKFLGVFQFALRTFSELETNLEPTCNQIKKQKLFRDADACVGGLFFDT